MAGRDLSPGTDAPNHLMGSSMPTKTNEDVHGLARRASAASYRARAAEAQAVRALLAAAAQPDGQPDGRPART